MCACVCLSVSVCLSVCLSVASHWEAMGSLRLPPTDSSSGWLSSLWVASRGARFGLLSQEKVSEMDEWCAWHGG